MEYKTCYYDHRLPGAPWDVAIETALAGYTQEERRKVQLVVLPECLRRKRSRRDEQMQFAGMK